MGVAERKEREKKQRRKAILKAAKQVFFSKGVEQATMDEVAKAAELSKGTLYLYYKNKTDLLHAIIARALDKLYAMFETAVKKEEKGIDKIRAIGTAYHEFYQKETDYYLMLLHQEDSDEIDDEYIERNPCVKECREKGNRIFTLMKETVETGIEDGSIRPDLDPMKAAVVMWGHSSGVMHIAAKKGKILEHMMKINSGELIQYSFQLMGHYLENKK
ncbi:MAG: TetR/AcrR family transcriptional regulator [bacterium]|nr:TetR/AcrR family transcriptional regulator [bacterium]